MIQSDIEVVASYPPSTITVRLRSGDFAMSMAGETFEVVSPATRSWQWWSQRFRIDCVSYHEDGHCEAALSAVEAPKAFICGWMGERYPIALKSPAWPNPLHAMHKLIDRPLKRGEYVDVSYYAAHDASDWGKTRTPDDHPGVDGSGSAGADHGQHPH